MASTIKTRFLILSDTHGEPLARPIDQKVDVAIDCGDLTEDSKLHEFKTSLELLKAISAPLKLVIARNHNFTLDPPVFRQKIAELERLHGDCDDLIKREYGGIGEARQLIDSEKAKSAGIVFLDEGRHNFALTNGAELTVDANPNTPWKEESGWGFKYRESEGHEWAIETGTDILITHCPPRGV